jgi:hypothetical protein
MYPWNEKINVIRRKGSKLTKTEGNTKLTGNENVGKY